MVILKGCPQSFMIALRCTLLLSCLILNGVVYATDIYCVCHVDVELESPLTLPLTLPAFHCPVARGPSSILEIHNFDDLWCFPYHWWWWCPADIQDSLARLIKLSSVTEDIPSVCSNVGSDIHLMICVMQVLIIADVSNQESSIHLMIWINGVH